jgi:hypothetical protein
MLAILLALAAVLMLMKGMDRRSEGRPSRGYFLAAGGLAILAFALAIAIQQGVFTTPSP